MVHIVGLSTDEIVPLRQVDVQRELSESAAVSSFSLEEEKDNDGSGLSIEDAVEHKVSVNVEMVKQLWKKYILSRLMFRGQPRVWFLWM